MLRNATEKELFYVEHRLFAALRNVRDLSKYAR